VPISKITRTGRDGTGETRRLHGGCARTLNARVPARPNSLRRRQRTQAHRDLQL